jgi:hypothetical protein
MSDMLGSSKKKADYIKGQIRDRINAMLGNRNLVVCKLPLHLPFLY